MKHHNGENHVIFDHGLIDGVIWVGFGISESPTEEFEANSTYILPIKDRNKPTVIHHYHHGRVKIFSEINKI